MLSLSLLVGMLWVCKDCAAAGFSADLVIGKSCKKAWRVQNEKDNCYVQRLLYPLNSVKTFLDFSLVFSAKSVDSHAVDRLN
jgi:hypothetical protein